MGAKDLKAKNRKEVELTDGSKIICKKLLPIHWAESGLIPDILFQPDTDPVKRKETLSDKKVLDALQKIAFLKSPIPTPDFVPVNKPTEQCAENEICYEDMDAGDLSKILIVAMTGGSGQSPESFPAKSEEQKP